MPYDAVYVYCNMSSGGETCVFPDIHSSQMPNIPWRKEADKTDWYSNLRGGFRVGHDIVVHAVTRYINILAAYARPVILGVFSRARNTRDGDMEIRSRNATTPTIIAMCRYAPCNGIVFHISSFPCLK